jgi:hypothetical protein
MGFFAVLQEDTEQSFAIKKCDINLWSLAALFGRRTFFFDVGLLVEATGSKPLQNFQVGVPFGTDSKALTDLTDRMLNPKVSELIFGERVNIVPRDNIDFGLGPVRLGRVSVHECSRDDRISGLRFSLWNLRLASPLLASQQAYLRIRFQVNTLGRTWVWKRSGLAKNEALVDFRIADLREAWMVLDRDALWDRIVAIEALAVFVIAPAWLELRAASPDLRYMRLLEGRVWEDYLGRVTDLRRSGKLIIHYWKRDQPNDPVDSDRPFRGFLHLSRAFGFIPAWNHVRAAVIFLLVILAAAKLDTRSWLASGTHLIDGGKGKVLNGLGLRVVIPAFVVLLATALGWLFKERDFVQRLGSGLISGFLKFERGLYKARRG